MLGRDWEGGPTQATSPYPSVGLDWRWKVDPHRPPLHTPLRDWTDGGRWTHTGHLSIPLCGTGLTVEGGPTQATSPYPSEGLDWRWKVGPHRPPLHTPLWDWTDGGRWAHTGHLSIPLCGTGLTVEGGPTQATSPYPSVGLDWRWKVGPHSLTVEGGHLSIPLCGTGLTVEGEPTQATSPYPSVGLDWRWKVDPHRPPLHTPLWDWTDGGRWTHTGHLSIPLCGTGLTVEGGPTHWRWKVDPPLHTPLWDWTDGGRWAHTGHLPIPLCGTGLTVEGEPTQATSPYPSVGLDWRWKVDPHRPPLHTPLWDWTDGGRWTHTGHLSIPLCGTGLTVEGGPTQATSPYPSVGLDWRWKVGPHRPPLHTPLWDWTDGGRWTHTGHLSIPLCGTGLTVEGGPTQATSPYPCMGLDWRWKVGPHRPPLHTPLWDWTDGGRWTHTGHLSIPLCGTGLTVEGGPTQATSPYPSVGLDWRWKVDPHRPPLHTPLWDWTDGGRWTHTGHLSIPLCGTGLTVEGGPTQATSPYPCMGLDWRWKVDPHRPPLHTPLWDWTDGGRWTHTGHLSIPLCGTGLTVEGGPTQATSPYPSEGLDWRWKVDPHRPPLHTPLWDWTDGGRWTHTGHLSIPLCGTGLTVVRICWLFHPLIIWIYRIGSMQKILPITLFLGHMNSLITLLALQTSRYPILWPFKFADYAIFWPFEFGDYSTLWTFKFADYAYLCPFDFTDIWIYCSRFSISKIVVSSVDQKGDES